MALLVYTIIEAPDHGCCSPSSVAGFSVYAVLLLAFYSLVHRMPGLLLGTTHGMALIGSVYASLSASRLTDALPPGLPARLTSAAHDSVVAALAIADRAPAGLGAPIHAAASAAFFDGLSAGCLVAAGVAAAGAVMAAVLLPAQPLRAAGGELALATDAS